MKLFVLVLAMVVGFAAQHEGCVAERVAGQAVQVGQTVKTDARGV